MQVGMPLLAAHAFTFLPLVTLPVNATLAKRGSELQCDHQSVERNPFLEKSGVWVTCNEDAGACA